MANPLPPNHVADLHEDELVHPEHTPIMPDQVPAQPKGYISDDDMEEDLDEEPKEEPEQEPEFASFAQAAQNNMNGWLEEDDDEDEMEAEEAKEVEVEIDDDKDDAEVIHPYEEADPLNKPPPNSNIEPEAVAAAPTPVGCATLQPLSPLLRFSGTFYTGAGSSATPFTANNCKVPAPGPLGKNLDTLNSKVKSLARQMKDRFDNEIKIQKNFKHTDLCMNSFDYDLSTLDSTLREQILKNSKMMQLFTELSDQAEYHHKTAEYHHYHFARVSWHYDHLSCWESGIRKHLPRDEQYREVPYDPSHPTLLIHSNDPYVMARDAAADLARDDDDDSTAPRDPQPSQPRGSPRDL
ncbi:hypothetical protein Tco_1044114 [Tanacetum coccineum]|uniref:Uncharacterized protein n=1 Tax=Tanacetum coccineum TaxID=301880 RepID=A0ABQ5GQ83_9ASTR